MRRRAAAIVLGTAILSLGAGERAAAAETSPGAPQIQAPVRSVLKNGLTLLVFERRSIPLVQFRLLIKAGSTTDPAGREGTAELTARLLRRGTKTRQAQQFAEETEFVGGSLVTVTETDSTLVCGEFASRDTEIAFNLLADMVLNPAFREEEVEREKRQMAAEITSLLDDPWELVHQVHAAWLFGPHPYGRPVIGTKASVAGLGRADVAAFHEARFAPNNAILAIAGDISATEAAQRVTRHFGAWKKRTVPPLVLPEAAPVKGRRVLLVDKPDATQSHIAFGNLGLKSSDPEYLPLVVANTVLGNGFTSWLVDEVRVKRGLTYNIHSHIATHRGAGSLTVGTFTRNAAAVETLQVSLEQLKRLRAGAVSAEDLDKARNYQAGLYPLRIETPEALAMAFVKADFFGLDPQWVPLYQKRVRAVGLDAVKKVAARLVSPDDLAIVVIGPAAELKDRLAPFGPVTVRSLEAAFGPY